MVFYLDSDHITQVHTSSLDKETLNAELLDILSLLASYDIKKVRILFGFAWGLEYMDFTPYEVLLTHVPHELMKAEHRHFGSLGEDDFRIQLECADMELLFSHDSTIQLSYNNRNPLIEDIVNDWKLKNIAFDITHAGYPVISVGKM